MWSRAEDVGLAPDYRFSVCISAIRYCLIHLFLLDFG